MSKDIIEFTIPNWALCALINGDYSGMDEQDGQKLNAFIERTIERHGNAHFSLPSEDLQDLGFRYKNDIDSMGSDCSMLLLMPNEWTKEESKVNRKLKKEGVTTNECSPNVVALYAFNLGIRLTSEQVVRISNNYYK